ncbi:MAG: hypothetical protein ABI577_10410 [bacterium]
MAVRALALLLVSIPLLAACSEGRDYPSNKGDGDYDLAAMSLRESDMPPDFVQQQIDEPAFDNQRWATEVFDTDDPEAKAAQLDAQGRLTNHVAAFTPPGLGKVLSITSVSTLYTNDKAAEEATNRFACGLPIKESVPLEPFIVPKIADQTTGFFVAQDNGSGLTFVDTTLCFRTGRIVHALQQTSLPGVEDIAAAVRLAERWLEHVNDSFDGKPVPTPEEG